MIKVRSILLNLQLRCSRISVFTCRSVKAITRLICILYHLLALPCPFPLLPLSFSLSPSLPGMYPFCLTSGGINQKRIFIEHAAGDCKQFVGHFIARAFDVVAFLLSLFFGYFATCCWFNCAHTHALTHSLTYSLTHSHTQKGLCKCNKLYFIMKNLNASRPTAACATTTTTITITATTSSHKNPINCYFICLLFSDYATTTTATTGTSRIEPFCILIYNEIFIYNLINKILKNNKWV